MIKLKIKQIKSGIESEQIIDFEGTVKGKFITENNERYGTITWCPVLAYHGWEVIEEIKN